MSEQMYFWVRVEDELPDSPNEEVLIWPRTDYETGFYSRRAGGWIRGGKAIEVTHWMSIPPLPPGPNEE